MFGERHHSPPGPPGVDTQDPEVMRDYAELGVAYARLMQRAAPQSRAMPRYEPPIEHAPPPIPNPPSSKRTRARDPGSSLWTLVVCLIFGAVIGVACDRQMFHEQQQPEQQLCR